MHRVLHVLDHSLPVQSGYTYRTLSILKAQRSLGWETFHLTSPKQASPSISYEAIDDWHFFRTKSGIVWPDLPGWRDLHAARATMRRLDELVRQLKPTVIHAHSPLLNGFPALWIGRRHRLPVLYEVRAFWEDAAVDQGTTRHNDVRYRTTRTLETELMRRADAVVTICDGLRQEIEARGITSDKLTVVPNVIDNAAFSRTGDGNPDLRKSLSIKRNDLVLGFIGSFYHYEGLDFLVRESAKLLHAQPELKFLLVGGGPAYGEIDALIKKLDLTGQIILTGRVSHENVAAYYELIDVFVYPRLRLRLTELVTPLKPLEAMAMGRIVVASDVGGHRELIDHSRTGYLFAANSGEALRSTLSHVLKSRIHLQTMGEQARAYVVAHRSIDRMAQCYARAYSCLPARTGAPTANQHILS